MIGAAVLGMGFMGATHTRAYLAAAAAGLPCRLVAVSDPDPARLSGAAAGAGNLGATSAEQLFDPAAVRRYQDPDELFADAAVQLVSICTYTDSHVSLAAKALKAGKHVLVEKPVSLDPEEIARLESAAASAGRLCMPAMCMRFWPGWDWLYDRIRDRSLGVLRSISLTRLGSGPSWASEFYRDVARSGGALVDLHIHDADFACWCFGRPNAVSSAGDEMHVTTHYHFTSGPNHVVAEGAWDLAPASGFRMRYLANFEQATAEFDISRTPWLRLHRAAGSEDIALLQGTGYDGEIRHLVSNISAGSSALRATLADAALVARVLEAERRSQRTRQPVEV